MSRYVTKSYGFVALVMSVIGFLGISFVASAPYLFLVPTVLCPVSLVVALIGLWVGEKGFAKWAAAIGVLGMMYLPTIWHSVLSGHLN